MKRYLTGLSVSVLLGLCVGSKAQDIHFHSFMKMRYSVIQRSQVFSVATTRSA